MTSSLPDSSGVSSGRFSSSEPHLTTPPKVRICLGEECGKPIPQARLRAMPNARHCVPCQEKEEARGSHQIRRFDEIGPDGEVHQIYFTDNRVVQREIHRKNRAIEHNPSVLGYAEDQRTEQLSPENTSVHATNLGSAVQIQEQILHEAGSSLYQGQAELRKTA